MIDATKLDFESRKDLLYDIRDGKVKYDDVIWGYLKENNSIRTAEDVTSVADNLNVESVRQSMVDYLNTYMIKDSNLTKDQRTWWNNCITFITTSIITGNSDDFIKELIE